MDLHASDNLVFSIPMWLTCNCCSAVSYGDTGIIILLPFIMMPSMPATSSQCPVWLYFFYDLNSS